MYQRADISSVQTNSDVSALMDIRLHEPLDHVMTKSSWGMKDKYANNSNSVQADCWPVHRSPLE